MKKCNLKNTLIIFLVVSYVMAFANIVVGAEDSVLENAKEKLTFSALTQQSIENVHDDFELPVQFEGTIIIWKSNNTDVLSIEHENGKQIAKVHASPYGEGIGYVILTAYINYEDKFTEKRFAIQVTEDDIGISMAKYISKCKEKFEQIFLSSQNINAITNNLVIPKIDDENVTYTVKSDNPDILTDDGVVMRSVEKDEIANLEVVFSYYTESVKVSYPIVIKALDDEDVDGILLSDMEDAVATLKNSYSLNSLTKDINLPSNGKYGSTFTWESNDDSVINGSGKISRGDRSRSAELKLTGSLSGITKEISMSVTVMKKGSSDVQSSSGGGVGSSRGESSIVQKPIKPSEPSTSVFSDLSETHWAYSSIMKLYEDGIVDGYEDNTIRPEGNIRREEAAKLIITALDADVVDEYANSFDDVIESDWFYDVVMLGAELGMINGIGNNKFGTGQLISRQDLAVMLYRISNVDKIEGQAVMFNDVTEISDYAQEAILSLANAGVITGDENRCFNPKRSASRAEAMTMLAKIIKH